MPGCSPMSFGTSVGGDPLYLATETTRSRGLVQQAVRVSNGQARSRTLASIGLPERLKNLHL